MNVREVLTGRGINPRKMSGVTDEYACACPFCGGDPRKSDRLRVWPNQNDGRGAFWCRSCGEHGDNITLVMRLDGVGFKEAVAITGDSGLLKTSVHSGASSDRIHRVLADQSGRLSDFTPREYADVSETWADHAEKLVAWAIPRLAGSPGMETLAQKGISPATAAACRLGWLPQDVYRVRESWGFAPKISDKTGKPKRLWFPCGLVIPDYAQECPRARRLRIRRCSGEPRYYVIEGSSLAAMCLGEVSRCVVVVESELDAILIWQLAGDITSVVAMGSASIRPDVISTEKIAAASRVLVALDADDPGDKSSIWWLKTFRHARRLRPESGKDPSDMWRAGGDIRQWIISGWPESWKILSHQVSTANTGTGAHSGSQKDVPIRTTSSPEAIERLGDTEATGPDSIGILGDILRRNSRIMIVVNEQRMTISAPPDWKMRHPSLFGQLSRLVFFDPDVFGFLHQHPQRFKGVTAGNLR